MESNLLFQSSLFKRSIGLLLLCLIQISLFAQQTDKIKGLSFLGPKRSNSTQPMMANIQNSQANWMAFVPQATLERKTLELLFDQPHDWWSKTIPGVIEGITAAKKEGFNIMLKPHIVLDKIKKEPSKLSQIFSVIYNPDKTNGADWRGNFKARNQGDWKIWKIIMKNIFFDWQPLLILWKYPYFVLVPS